MRKAELKDCYDTYSGLVVSVNDHLSHRRFDSGLQVCLQALEYIVPSLKYTKQYGNDQDISQLVPIIVVCSYGPPLFEHDVIDRTRQFIESTKQLSKHPAGYLGALDSALEAEEVARRAWNAIENEPGIDFKKLCQQSNGRRRSLVQSWIPGYNCGL